MKKQTRYFYEKRIRELENKNYDLSIYKNICSEIYRGVLEVWGEGNQISHKWIIEKFDRVWK